MVEERVIKKVLNNNMAIAIHPKRGEIVVIGKRENDLINQSQIEKNFILQGEKEKQQYEMLVEGVSEKLVETNG